MNDKLFASHKKEEIITSLSQKLFKTALPIHTGTLPTFTSQKPQISVQQNGPARTVTSQLRMKANDTNDDPSKKAVGQQPLKHAYAGKAQKYFDSLNSNYRSNSMYNPNDKLGNLDMKEPPIEKKP